MKKRQTEQDKREHMRLPVSSRVRVKLPNGAETETQTRDLSDGGVFVVLSEALPIAVGDRISLQVIDIQGEAPIIEAVVIRVDPTGMGVKFV